MAVRFSTNDLENAARAANILAAPLDHATTDEWRSAVNRCLQPLLSADSAGFLLPSDDGPVVYSDEHDPEELAKYPELTPPPLSTGQSVFARMIEMRVARLDDAYGADLETYLTSEYYNEYAGANGAHDTLGAMVSLGGETATTIAGLQFWHDSPTGRKFGEHEVELLRLLYPAFTAGVAAQVRWGQHRTDLLSMLDSLGQSTMVCGSEGEVVHQTPGLTEAISADAEGERIRHNMIAAAKAAGNQTSCPAGLTRDVQTELASYRISAARYPSLGPAARALVLVALDRTSPVLRDCSELQRMYGLTQTEVRVAALLARGSSNSEVASELYISPHTARRHTERILLKMKARSRAEIPMKLLR